MTEKRFRVQEHCLRSSYGIEAENWLVTNDNHSVVLNNKAEAHMVANMSNNVINKLNKLHEKNKDLEEARSYYQENFLTMKTERNKLKEENNELKVTNGEMEEENKELKSLCKVLIKHIEKKSIAFVIDEEVRRLLE